MYRKSFYKSLRKSFSFFKKYQVKQKSLLKRCYTPETPLDYTPGSQEYIHLKNEIRETLSKITQIPICIGEEGFGSSDVHYQRVPHNKRCFIAQSSTGNSQILEQGERIADRVKEEWRAVSMRERMQICLRCADILANEDRHALNASIILGQSKTIRQAEEDTCRTINDLRCYAELLPKLSKDPKLEPKNNFDYLMRSSGGFIASMTPYNWTSQAINLALCPALMGNCVLWVPSPFNVLSSYKLFLALDKAGLPGGVISFIPMNQNYFVDKTTKTNQLAGFNYAGRLSEYEILAKGVSLHMDRPNSFSHPIGPAEGKNFHFVHESANVSEVAIETVRAAFDYNGQRCNSCENLYVPCSLWQDLRCALIEELSKLTVGDACDFETTNTAVISLCSFNRIVKLLQHAELEKNCDIVCGGNYNSTHGFFIEPTVIECKSPHEELMTIEIEGPVLCLYVYGFDETEEILDHLCTSSYALAGAIFAEDEDMACQIAKILTAGAANLYINKACIGESDKSSAELPDFNRQSIASQISLFQHWK